MFKLIILDRDGVINHDSDAYIKSPDEWQAIDGSLAAISHINHLNIPVCVCTNQSGIARGYYDENTLSAIHDKMHSQLREANAQVDRIYYCPHGPNDDCDCRKPKSGMILQALRDFQVQPEQAIVVGDAWRDCQAGLNVGTTAALVQTGKGSKTLAQLSEDDKQSLFGIHQDLADFVKQLKADQ